MKALDIPKRPKCRNPIYLGLLPAPRDGHSDITALYVAKQGVPPGGTRLFIRTRQECNGWLGEAVELSAIVPPGRHRMLLRRRR